MIARPVVLLLAGCLVLAARGAWAERADGGEKNIGRSRPGSQKWALLVGVDDYAEVVDLAYCGRDVRGLRGQLLAAGFPDQHVILLDDESGDRKYFPFKSNVETQLELLLGVLDDSGKRLARQGLVESGDLVIVAFSGHGVHLDDQSYLCPADARLEKPDSLVSVERLYQLLAASPAGVKLMLIDACRNDPRPGGVRSLTATPSTRAFARSLESPPQGILVLSSCEANQVSVEDPDFGHGVFMNFVLEGLAGAADRDEGNRNRRVSLLEMYRYASVKTKAHVARTRNLLQTPVLRGEISGDFEFGEIGELPKEAINPLGMKLVLIPAGTFAMGSSDGHENERPPHEVEITRPFYIGATEVTQGQYQAVMGVNPSDFCAAGAKASAVAGEDTRDFPVENVSYEDAVAFCHRLASLENLPKGTYRLPTEAEWEYAARGGDSGEHATAIRHGMGLERFAWFAENADYRPHGVAQRLPNGYGLYDTAGNVSEWCSDWFDAEHYRRSQRQDPQGPAAPGDTPAKVLRGGHWIAGATACRATDRDAMAPQAKQRISGFRVVRGTEPPP